MVGLDGAGGGWIGHATWREALAAGAAIDAEMTFGPPAHVSRAAAETSIGTFNAQLRQLRALGQQLSPSALLPVVGVQALAVRALAVAARSHRPELFQVASRYAEFTGWMAQESGHDAEALRWTDQAVELAGVGGDPVMAAYALVRYALIAFYQDDAARTIGLARRSQQAPGASPRVRGLGALREAQGLALLGLQDECWRALDRASDHLARYTHDPDQPVLGSSTVADPVSMATGWCLYDLGWPREAAAVLDAEIAKIPQSAQRARTRYSARRALAYAALGEIEHACELTSDLLTGVREVDSATIRRDVSRLYASLNRWPTHQAVRDLQPELIIAIRAGGRRSSRRGNGKPLDPTLRR
jgi:hypothetical protein